MAQSLPFQFLIERAKEETDAAVRKLGELNRKNREMEEKLALLLQYRQEYQQRLDASTKDGITRAVWENYQNFLLKLDNAIELQKQAQAEFLKVVDAGRIEYQQKQTKLKSFETLEQRHREQEAAKVARREQKELDEYSSKLHMRRYQEED
jgi:flagellar FliJ protein